MMTKLILCFAALVLIPAGATASLPDSEVFDDARTIAIAVIGSVIGAFLTIALFPTSDLTEETRARRLSLKFGASLLSGVAFAPAMMQWIGVQKSVDYLMGCSALTAVFAVSGLHLLAPRLEKLIDRWTNQKT